MVDVDAPNEGATGDFAPDDQTPPGGGAGPQESPLSAAFAEDAFADRPELFVGAAFAGGFVLAQILKRLAR
jgi:hypothetical protein